MQKITVITADIIDSRMEAMSENELARCLSQVTLPALLVPFSVSRGDEVQGIMAGWLSAPQIVRQLRWRCQTLQLRIGIGIGYHEGELGTDSWKLNGPAFFRARQALDSIGEEKNPATKIVTGWEEVDHLVNSIWLLMDTFTHGWTSGQWEAVMTYEQAGTLAAAGKLLGVAPQNVQKRCRAAHWNQVRQAEIGLSNLEKLLAFNPRMGEEGNITQKKVKGEDR